MDSLLKLWRSTQAGILVIMLAISWNAQGKPPKKLPGKLPRKTAGVTPAKYRFPIMQVEKSDDEIKYEQYLDKEIQRLEELLSKQTKDTIQAKTLHMLGRLSYEKARFLRYREMQNYDKNVEKWMQSGRSRTGYSEPKIDDRESRAFVRKSVDALQKLIRTHKEYDQIDEALFYLGFILNETGLSKNGISQYHKIIKTYPNSRYTPISYLAMGESYFESSNFVKAKAAYSSALEDSEAEVKAFSLYKLAWCFQRTGDTKKALALFRRLLDFDSLDRRDDFGNKTGGPSFRSRVLHEMVFLISGSEIKNAFDKYFSSQIVEDEVKQTLLMLADAYRKNSKEMLAINTLRRFLNDFPEDPSCPRIQLKIIELYRNGDNYKQVLREVNRLVEKYRPNSRWTQINREMGLKVDDTTILIEKVLRKLTEEIHLEAKQTKKWENLDLARRMYDKYLNAFEESEYALRFRWQLADIQYRMGDYYGSAQQAAKVVKRTYRPASQIKPAYHVVLCWSRCIEIREKEGIDCRHFNAKTAKKKYIKEKQRRIYMSVYSSLPINESKKILLSKKTLPGFEKHFFKAAQDYFRISSQHGFDIDVAYYTALIMYRHGYYDQMAKQATQLIDSYPQDERTKTIVELSLKSMHERAQSKHLEEKRAIRYWSVLNTFAKTLTEKNEFIGGLQARKGKLDKQIRDMLKQSEFEILMAFRISQPKQAAFGLKKFGKDYISSSLAARALYEAMLIFERAGNLDQAIETGYWMIKNLPRHKLQGTYAVFLAEIYTKVADLGHAAESYEIAFERFLKQTSEEMQKSYAVISEQNAKHALYTAARYREKTGDFKKALKNYGKFVKQFPNSQKAALCLFDMARINEINGRWRKAERYYQAIQLKYQGLLGPAKILQAAYKRGLAYCKLGAFSKCHSLLNQAVEEYDRLVAGERSNEARKAAAHAWFLLLEPKIREYFSIKLFLSDEKSSKENLAKKMFMREELERKYKRMFDYKSNAWSIAATVRIGKLNQHLSQALYEIKAPVRSNANQKNDYKKELDRQALSLEENAISEFMQAIERSFSKNIYSNWVLEAQNNLRKLRSNTYPKPFKGKPVSTSYLSVKGPDLDFKDVGSAQ